MKEILNRVTITGADDTIDTMSLGMLQRDYPFVEWGILVSEARLSEDGSPRFPSTAQLEKLADAVEEYRLRLSVHICGRWVRQVMKGDFSWLAANYEVARLIAYAGRIQLNYHGRAHKMLPPAELAKALKVYWPGKQIICQVDGVNDETVSHLYDEGLDVAALYDKSGGAGRLPESWPHPLKGIYCGYAGGLSPENVVEQLEQISKLVTDPVWIDTETRVRSDDDSMFMLAKANDFLSRAEEWVIPLTCHQCDQEPTCKWANDLYNTGGDCLAEK